jgi:hypothetical protein
MSEEPIILVPKCFGKFDYDKCNVVCSCKRECLANPINLIRTIDKPSLIVENFMGGKLSIPLIKCDIPEQILVGFLQALFMVKGVREVFEEYGAKLEVDK